MAKNSLTEYGEDFLTHEGRIRNRIKGYYAKMRAAGYGREEVCLGLVEDLESMAYHDIEAGDKDFTRSMADKGKIESLLDDAQREICSEAILLKIKEAQQIYSNGNARYHFPKEKLGRSSFPLFSEKVYDDIREVRKKQLLKVKKRI